MHIHVSVVNNLQRECPFHGYPLALPTQEVHLFHPRGFILLPLITCGGGVDSSTWAPTAGIGSTGAGEGLTQDGTEFGLTLLPWYRAPAWRTLSISFWVYFSIEAAYNFKNWVYAGQHQRFSARFFRIIFIPEFSFSSMCHHEWNLLSLFKEGENFLMLI